MRSLIATSKQNLFTFWYYQDIVLFGKIFFSCRYNWEIEIEKFTLPENRRDKAPEIGNTQATLKVG